MKLTLSQRLKILFTGKMPEPLIAIDKNIFTIKTGVLRPYGPVIDSPRTTLTHDDYVSLAKQCRKNPNKWIQITIKPCKSARPLASKIKHGSILAFRKPRGGHYDAHATEYMGEYIVEAKFIPNNKKEETK